MTPGTPGIEARRLRCWVCGSDRNEPFRTRGIQVPLESQDLRITDARYGLTLSLVKCVDCGFRFADTDEVSRLESLYAQLDDPGYRESQDSRNLQMRWLVQTARGFRPDATTALDVGAASGLLVAEAQRQGLETIGVEPSRWLVNLARDQQGVTVLEGVLPHPELAQRRFDLVFLVDVIEHVADPVGILRHCAERLTERGVLLLVTPDVGSLAARVLRGRWWHYRLAHVGYFDRHSLCRAFQRARLSPLAWRRARWFFSVAYLATRLESYFPVGWFNRLALRTAPLRWLYERVVPVNLRDSYVVSLARVENDDE